MPKTTRKVKKLITKAEKPLPLYLATNQILNSSGKVWSGIITSPHKILARFNNHQVVRPLEAKAYLILRTIYWLIEQKHFKALLFTDNLNIHHRFLKLSRLPLEKPYSLEPHFRLTQRGKIPWPKYLWLARKLIAEHHLNITLNYLKPPQNPASLITKNLKTCAKCEENPKIKAYFPWQKKLFLLLKSLPPKTNPKLISLTTRASSIRSNFITWADLP